MLAVHYGQHRDPSLGVVVFDQDGQRPEVHRRPEEYHRKQQPRKPIEFACDGRPTHERREGPRRAPDDNVLPGAALQEERIDKDVKQQASEGQQGGQHIRNGGNHPERDDGERQGEQEGIASGNDVGDRGAAGRAFHRHVEVALYDHIDRVGSARHHVAAEGDTYRHKEGRPALVRHHHRGDSGEQQERDDARFGECDIGPDLRGEAFAGAEARQRIFRTRRVVGVG